MRNSRLPGPPAVGGSSLLVIFAVLCLTVLAMLALSTVRADDRLADASVEAVAAYYRADAEAESILARLRSSEVPEGVAVRGDLFTYACSISDTRTLQVEVRVDGSRYAVLRWQEESTADWNPDTGLHLWDGES